MKHFVLAALALAAAPTAVAEPVSFIEGGVGIALREPDRDPPVDVLDFEYEDGTTVFLSVGSHYASGVLLRVDYAYTYYDALTAVGGAITLEEDIQSQDARGGLFLATRHDRPLGGRIGLGYAYSHERAYSSSTREHIQDGGFLEAAAGVASTHGFGLELAATVMKLDGRANYDADVGELRLTGRIPAGAAQVLVTARYAAFDREDRYDEDLLELRLGLGGVWE